MLAMLIENGIVVGIISVDDVDVFIQNSPEFCAQYDEILQSGNEPGSPGIGWLYSNGEFTRPQPDE